MLCWLVLVPLLVVAPEPQEMMTALSALLVPVLVLVLVPLLVMALKPAETALVAMPALAPVLVLLA